MTCGQTLVGTARYGRAQTDTDRGPGFKVRDARKRELLLIADMRKRLAELLRELHPGLIELTPEEMAKLSDRYAEVMASGKGRVLVAVDHADVPIGMIVVRLLENPRIEPGRFGRIDDAWVEPEFRRQGVMRGLVRAAAAYATAKGFDRMMLDWSVRNVVSARSWRGLGFEPMLVVGMAVTSELAKGGQQ